MTMNENEITVDDLVCYYYTIARKYAYEIYLINDPIQHAKSFDRDYEAAKAHAIRYNRILVEEEPSGQLVEIEVNERTAKTL